MQKYIKSTVCLLLLSLSQPTPAMQSDDDSCTKVKQFVATAIVSGALGYCFGLCTAQSTHQKNIDLKAANKKLKAKIAQQREEILDLDGEVRTFRMRRGDAMVQFNPADIARKENKTKKIN